MRLFVHQPILEKSISLKVYTIFIYMILRLIFDKLSSSNIASIFLFYIQITIFNSSYQINIISLFVDNLYDGSFDGANVTCVDGV